MMLHINAQPLNPDAYELSISALFVDGNIVPAEKFTAAQRKEAMNDGRHYLPLRFSWEPETGEISGPDADLVRAGLGAGEGVAWGPYPGGDWHNWSADPARSRTDVAVLIATHWQVPDELRADLPATPGPEMIDGEPLLDH